MITTYLHYPQGTCTAVETPTGYTTQGYVPSRQDKLITAYIVTQDGYELYIDAHSLVLKHKYITIEYSRFTIGNTAYPIHYIHQYLGSERQILNRLVSLRDEVLNTYTVDGLDIEYKIREIIKEMITL